MNLSSKEGRECFNALYRACHWGHVGRGLQLNPFIMIRSVLNVNHQIELVDWLDKKWAMEMKALELFEELEEQDKKELASGHSKSRMPDRIPVTKTVVQESHAEGDSAVDVPRETA